ncbi:MAG: hypothetical protein V4503_05315 [Gemmatimonadota bacterium]
MNQRSSRGIGLLLTLGLTAMGLFFLAFVMDETRNTPGPMPVFSLLVGGGVFAALMFGPVGKALGRMLEGDTPQLDDQVTMRVEDLEARVAELTMEQSRVAELEDRLDFTERMIASSQRNEPGEGRNGA